jgi:predicted amidohydrolase
MKIAAVQFCPDDENIQKNMEAHLHWTQRAATAGASLVVFPELSLTGYHIERAHEFRFTLNDARLQTLQQLADRSNITVVAGAPVETDSGLHIGAVILSPHKEAQLYTKQYLHAGEERSFVPSFAYDPLLEIEGERISLAVCADITHAEHPAAAARNNASVYLAGIFYVTPNGMQQALTDMSAYAKTYRMKTTIANFCGRSHGGDARGTSTIWNAQGEIVAQLSETEEGMIVG